jgi:RNA polymerase sigma-70 factor (ECF subfamily)
MTQVLELLFREHWTLVRRFAARRVGEASADDLAASVFELAHRKMPNNHPHPVGWLFRAAENLARAQLRGAERYRRAVEDLGHQAASGTVSGPDDEAILRSLLDQLPPRYRDVLQLTYWDGLSAADIGIVVGASVPAVWKRISRAKALLRASWPDPDEAQLTWEEMVTGVLSDQ